MKFSTFSTEVFVVEYHWLLIANQIQATLSTGADLLFFSRGGIFKNFRNLYKFFFVDQIDFSNALGTLLRPYFKIFAPQVLF